MAGRRRRLRFEHQHGAVGSLPMRQILEDRLAPGERARRPGAEREEAPGIVLVPQGPARVLAAEAGGRRLRALHDDLPRPARRRLRRREAHRAEPAHADRRHAQARLDAARHACAAIDDRLAERPRAHADPQPAGVLRPSCRRAPPRERVEAERAHPPASRAERIASPRSATSRRAACGSSACARTVQTGAPACDATCPAAGDPPSIRARRAPARSAIGAPRIDDPRRGRSGVFGRRRREPAAAGLACAARKAIRSPVSKNVERGAGPRIDLDQMPVRRADEEIDAVQADPVQRCRTTARAASPSCRFDVAAEQRRPHRAAVAEGSVGRAGPPIAR